MNGFVCDCNIDIPEYRNRNEELDFIPRTKHQNYFSCCSSLLVSETYPSSPLTHLFVTPFLHPLLFSQVQCSDSEDSEDLEDEELGKYSCPKPLMDPDTALESHPAYPMLKEFSRKG